MATFKADSANNARVKADFIEALKLDILQPTRAMLRTYQKINQQLVPQAREQTRLVRNAYQRYRFYQKIDQQLVHQAREQTRLV